MKKRILIILVLFLLFSPLTVFGATLEVGSGRTYSTIQAAVNAAIAGDIVLVYPGTYNEAVRIPDGKSGTPTSPITIKALYPARKPLDGGQWADTQSKRSIVNAGGGFAGIYNDCYCSSSQVKNIIIDGFYIIGGTSFGISFVNDDSIWIRNNVAINNGYTLGENNGNYDLVWTPNSLIQNNYGEFSVPGTYPTSMYNVDGADVIAEYNDCYTNSSDYSGRCFYVHSGSIRFIMRYNFILLTKQSSNQYARLRDTTDFKVTNNYIHALAPEYFMVLHENTDHGLIENHKINNNTFLYNQGGTYDVLGLGYLDNSEVKNNILVSGILDTNSYAIGPAWLQPSHSVAIENNIWYNFFGLVDPALVGFTQLNNQNIQPSVNPNTGCATNVNNNLYGANLNVSTLPYRKCDGTFYPAAGKFGINVTVIDDSTTQIPIITSTSQNTLTHNSALTISGAGFGTKATAAPLKYDDFESGTLGTNVGNGWSYSASGGNGLAPRYSNARLRTNSVKSMEAVFENGQWESSFGLTGETGLPNSIPGFNLPKIYMDVWYYYRPAIPQPSRNVKIFRIHTNTYSPNSHLNFWCDQQGGAVFTSGVSGVWLDTPPFGEGYFANNWRHLQLYLVQNPTPTSADGTAFFTIDGTVAVNRIGTWQTRTDPSQYYITLWIGNYMGHDAVGGCTESGDAYNYWDNAYIDTSWAHVEIGNASTYAASTHTEIQIPTSWSSSSITITANKGSFADGQTVYLYVVDETGAVNANGYPVTIAGGTPTPDTTPPVRSNLYPQGQTYPSSTTQVTISLNTNEVATCRFSTSPNIAYSSMILTFSTTGGTTHSTILPSLTPATYNYYVRCQDQSGNANTNDAQIYFTINTPDTTPPTQPTGLAATPASSTQINLAWTASTDNVAVAGYRIYRNSNPIATTTQTTYSDTGLTASTLYTYTVQAYDTSYLNSTQSSQAQTTTLEPSSCFTVINAWQNNPFTSQAGSFTAEFDATPNTANMDGVIGLSNNQAIDYTNLANIARFNTAGNIDARNGGVYAAANIIPYTPGIIYHFRLAIDILSHTYNIYVKQGVSAEQIIGSNFAFRTEQSAINNLNNLGMYAASGSYTLCNLTISSSAQVNDTTPQTTTHPRILITPSDITPLRNKMTIEPFASKYNALKSRVDAMTTPTTNNYLIGYQIQEIAFVALIENYNPIYMNKLDQWINNTFVTQNIVSLATSGDGGAIWGSADTILGMAMSYDWLYSNLSSARRIRYGAYLRDFQNAVISQQGGLTRDASRSDYSNQFFYFDGMLAVTGLTLENESIDDTLAQTYINSFNDNVRNHMIPVINQVGSTNGGYHEGLGYVDRALTQFTLELEVWRVAKGENLFPQTTGLIGLNKWLVYSTQPDNKTVNMGDVSGGPYLWGSGQGRVASLLASRFNDRFSQYVANRVDPAASGNWAYYPFYLLWYNTSVQEVNIANSNLAEYFDGIGWVSMRNNWGPSDTFAMFYSGNYYFGHQHYDQNSFVIFKNSPLAIDNGIYNVATPSYKTATRFHNTILVGPAGSDTSVDDGLSGQSGASPMYYLPSPETSSSDKGDILLFENSTDYTYTIGDASKSYDSSRLTSYTRKFLYLKPDTFLVLDRVTTPTTTYPVRWLLNSETSPTVAGDQVSISNGNGKIFSRTLLPASSTINVATVFAGDASYGGGNYRIEEVSNNPQTEEFFLHLLVAGDSSLASMPSNEIVSSNNLVGSRVGDKIILFARRTTPISQETYSVTYTGILKHLITDLAPSSAYYIYQQSNLINTKTTTNSGTLQFDSTNGGTFIISTTPQTSDTTPPSIINLIQSPISPATYTTPQTYTFTSTITDNQALQTVYLENNFNGVTINTTINSATSIYSYSRGALSAGTYTYKFIAIDTQGNQAVSAPQTYTVSQALSATNLSASPSSPIIYGTPTTVTCTDTNPQVSSNLYINSVLRIQGTYTLAAGIYNLTCITPSNQNYTQSANEISYQVNKAQPSLELRLNTQRSDMQIFQGQSVQIQSTLFTPAQGTLTIYQNNLLLTNSSSPLILNQTYNTVGSYNITSYFAGNQNYTQGYETHFVVVGNPPDTTPPSVTILSPPDNTITNNPQVQITCSASDLLELKNLSLILNNVITDTIQTTQTSLTNTFTKTLNQGQHTYTCQAYDNSSNKGQASQTRTITIDTTPPTLTVTSPQATTYNTPQVALEYSALDYTTLYYTLNSNPPVNLTQNIILTLSDANYNLTLFAFDLAGNRQAQQVLFRVDTSIATCTQNCEINISLAQGVNLVSLPLMPSNYSIEYIFSQIKPNINAIYTYDPNTFWKVYHPDLTIPSTLKDLQARKAFFVITNTPTTFTLRGDLLDSNNQIPPLSLTPGWNLIGVHNLTDQTPDEILVGYNYSSVWEFQSGTQSYRKLNTTLDRLSYSRGYWVFVQ